METKPEQIADTWLSSFATSVGSGDVKAISESFLPNGYLRDVLVFSKDTRSLCGHNAISDYLSSRLSTASLSGITLDQRANLAPETFSVSPTVTGVATAFTFRTKIGYGRGYARLLPDEQSRIWKALTVYTELVDIMGHEEVGFQRNLTDGRPIAEAEFKAQIRADIEADPYVLIVGAGQNGLQVAARFKQMKIRALIIDVRVRVGDQWRERYPTLHLHTTRTHHNLLYQPYPSNYPNFPSKDDVANWHEMYAITQDLVIWNNSSLDSSSPPKYDDETKQWDLVVRRHGEGIRLHPRHIVIATGTLGVPRYPSVDHKDFEGKVIHAAIYKGAKDYVGKRIIVIGAGNTAADICQDLTLGGAASVTMVQRSSTCVISDKTMAEKFEQRWPAAVPTEISDFKVTSMPLDLVRKISIVNKDATMAKDKELHAGLEAAGMKLNQGTDGSGQAILLFERFSGLDVGFGALVISGKVPIKQGVEIKKFKQRQVVFSDDSELDADAVIYATGYRDPRDSLKHYFDSDIIERAGALWGMDEEGELKGCYRPTGQPGFWYATGDFYNSRVGSKTLALHIKASELGL